MNARLLVHLLGEYTLVLIILAVPVTAIFKTGVVALLYGMVALALWLVAGVRILCMSFVRDGSTVVVRNPLRTYRFGASAVRVEGPPKKLVRGWWVPTLVVDGYRRPITCYAVPSSDALHRVVECPHSARAVVMARPSHARAVRARATTTRKVRRRRRRPPE